MVRVYLETVVMGNLAGSCLIMLRPAPQEGEHDRLLPICIGPVEAAAIAKAVSGEKSSRPMTHSLLCTVMSTLGGRLKRIVITRVKGTIFYASLHIQQGDTTIKVDARPSDAVALAVRLHVPMYVSEQVLEQASFPSWVNVKSEQERVEMEEFHSFVENLEPSDFALPETEA